MKINTAKLKRALDELKLIASRKAGLEILYCVHLKAENGYLKITASNLDEYQLERVECVGELAACCVGRERLGWAIGGEETIIELVGENLTVSFGRNEVNLQTLKAGEFPPWPAGEIKAADVPCPDLAKGIESVAFAACTNGERHELEAVHIVGQPKLITCEASNGRELAIWKTNLISAEFDILIPHVIAPNFCSALVKDGATFSISKNLVQVEHDFGKYAAKQIEGKFPNTGAVASTIKNQVDLGVVLIGQLGNIIDRCVFYGDPQKAMAVDISFSKMGAEFKCVGVNSNAVFYLDGSFPEWKSFTSSERMKKIIHAINTVSINLYGADGILIFKYGDVSVYTCGLIREEKKSSKKDDTKKEAK